MNGFCETTASARLWLYLKHLYFISSAIAYCISPYASFYAELSCLIFFSWYFLSFISFDFFIPLLFVFVLSLCYSFLKWYVLMSVNATARRVSEHQSLWITESTDRFLSAKRTSHRHAPLSTAWPKSFSLSPCMVFRRNVTHCISPYAIVMCVSVYVCVCVCVCRICEPQENGLR